jgi:hypothetical protein
MGVIRERDIISITGEPLPNGHAIDRLIQATSLSSVRPVPLRS